MLKLYNTLSRKIEDFRPIKKGWVSLYTCGPTVYNYAHIGNLRTYIFEDLLKRVLEYDGYKVNHAMNITDVGHLVGDGDEGEDKLEVGAKREGKNPLDIAKFYTEKFFADIDALNIIRPNQIISATSTISEQIEMIRILEQKGFTYKGEQAIYFDTSKFPDYGKLSGQKLSEKQTSRQEVVIDKDKKHPADFALWFFLTGRYQNHILQWDSPWGKGFPGWHIECSAISRKALGQPFDIHCGGVDHIGTHHTNEIAQSEAAFGVPLANVWMHGEFLQINSLRMGKSEGNFITLDTLREKGFSPLDYRYMCLQAHYRTQLNFTWDGLEAAHNAVENFYNRFSEFREKISEIKDINQKTVLEFKEKFKMQIENDLNIPEALGTAWEVIKDRTLTARDRSVLLDIFDAVFGLGLTDYFVRHESAIPENVLQLKNDREFAKNKKDFQKSDELRKQIEALGYEVMDTPEGQKVKKKLQI
jgi:cysteinyl-tRNA synthetase